MGMIDLYVNEVGEHLPNKVRADLETEIRSLIEDTLEDRSQAEGRAPDDEMIAEVLKEFGSPEKMAASYLPPRYLIGPRLFPTFWLVLRIVATVITVLGLVRIGIDFGQSSVTLESGLVIFGQGLAQLFTSLLAALGNVVFIFAILEWALPKTEKKEEEAWDPRALKSRPEPDKIKPLGRMTEIGFTLAAMLIFNVYPQLIGMGFQQDGHWVWVPVLAQGFFRYLPWLNILWVAQIVLNILLLRSGRWETGTRWYKLALDAFGLVIVGLMIVGDAIVSFSFAQMGIDPAQAQTLQALINNSIRLALVVAFVVNLVEIAKDLYRLLTRRSFSIAAQ